MMEIYSKRLLLASLDDSPVKKEKSFLKKTPLACIRWIFPSTVYMKLSLLVEVVVAGKWLWAVYNIP